MSWFSLILLSVTFSSVNSVIDKFFCEKKIKNILSYQTIGNLIQLPLIIILSLFIQPKNLSGWPFYLALVNGWLFFLMWFLYFQAITKVEVSRAASIFNVLAIFTAILAAIFLGEKITALRWLAIIIIVIGASLISHENSHDQVKESFNRQYLLVVLAALVGASGTILTKLVMGRIEALTTYVISFLGGFPIILFLLSKKEILKEVKMVLSYKKTLLAVVFGRLFAFISVCFYYLGLSKGSASSVNAVNSIGPLIVFIFSTFLSFFFPRIIQEKINKEVLVLKLVAIVLIVGGVIIININ